VSDVTLDGPGPGHQSAPQPNEELSPNTVPFLKRNGVRQLGIFTVPVEWKIKHILRSHSVWADKTDHDFISQGWVFWTKCAPSHN